jgi:hypothetical protein
MSGRIPPPGQRQRRQGAGFSIRKFAEHLDLPYGQVRKAVKNGEITIISFGGVRRIPPSEAERIRQLFGLKAPGDNDKGKSNGIDHQDQKQERHD